MHRYVHGCVSSDNHAPTHANSCAHAYSQYTCMHEHTRVTCKCMCAPTSCHIHTRSHVHMSTAIHSYMCTHILAHMYPPKYAPSYGSPLMQGDWASPCLAPAFPAQTPTLGPQLPALAERQASPSSSQVGVVSIQEARNHSHTTLPSTPCPSARGGGISGLHWP